MIKPYDSEFEKRLRQERKVERMLERAPKTAEKLFWAVFEEPNRAAVLGNRLGLASGLGPQNLIVAAGYLERTGAAEVTFDRSAGEYRIRLFDREERILARARLRRARRLP